MVDVNFTMFSKVQNTVCNTYINTDESLAGICIALLHMPIMPFVSVMAQQLQVLLNESQESQWHTGARSVCDCSAMHHLSIQSLMFHSVFFFFT